MIYGVIHTGTQTQIHTLYFNIPYAECYAMIKNKIQLAHETY